MARRHKILGLPIGKKKARFAPRALAAAGLGVIGVPAAVAASRRIGDVVSSGSEKAHQLSDLANKVGDAKDAAEQRRTKLGKAGAIVGALTKGGGDGGPPRLSHLIEEHIDVAAPRRDVYNQWTQFEMFPSIVKGAERVEQKERDKVEWTSKIGPSRRTWNSEITEQVPDERIAWKTGGGLQLKGVVTFHSLDEDLTHVLVQIEYDPRGPVEQVGNLMRIQRRRVRRDLRLFKHFVELRGEATGAWRNRIAKKGDSEDGDTEDGSEPHTGIGRAAERARRAVRSEPNLRDAPAKHGDSNHQATRRSGGGSNGRAVQRSRSSAHRSAHEGRTKAGAGQGPRTQRQGATRGGGRSQTTTSKGARSRAASR